MTPKELHEYRKSLSLTLKQFAMVLGKSSLMIWRYEKGLIKIPKHIENFLKSVEIEKIKESINQLKLSKEETNA
jgi:transcriptional regulator with XRE-family HTH domain